MIFLVVGISIVVTLLIVFGIGRALGPSKPKQAKFDETPADVTSLDTSNGVPLDLRYNPLAIDDGCCAVYRPSRLTAEEEAQATEALERFSERMRAEQNR